MTTTSQQPPEDDPSRGPGPHGPGRSDARGSGTAGSGAGQHNAGGAGDGASHGARRLSPVLLAGVAVVVLVLAALGWLFTAGPLSESAKQERAVESALKDMSGAASFAEFNEFLCSEQRVPQDLVDTITASGEQTGTNLDSMFRESIAGSLPEDLRVTNVEADGESAVATVESGSEGSQPEEVRMRNEDGAWKVCESEVGMGSVPNGAPAEQPS